jgi:alpha-tubulin suppressor-like RCC1 family protein
VAGGAVACWGTNGSGELGNRTVSAFSPPVPVWGLKGATAITATGRRTCALLGDGTVKCWGDDYRGGNGTGTTAPVLVTDL